MAITNAEIIAIEKLTRGIKEEIHTFDHWKSLGYSVKKGEKSEIKFPIWKYGKRKAEDGEEETEGYCFMKLSAFFKESQVEKLKARV